MTARPIDPTRRTRWPLIAIVILLGVLLAHTATWFAVSARMSTGLSAFQAEAAAAGWRIEHGPPQRGGWPLAATLQLPHLAATRELGGTTLRWTADRADLLWSPLDPKTLRIEVAGEQSLAWHEGPPLAFHAAGTLLRTPLSGTAPATLALTDLVAPSIHGTAIKARQIDVQLEPLALEGTVAGLELTPKLATPFDGPITASARLLSTRPFDSATTPNTAASAWRNAGGRIQAPTLQVDWGGLHATGSLEGGLDADLQPEGRATFQVQGALETLDAVRKGGLVAPGPASAARAVLGLLTLGAKGAPVTLPVSLKGHTLTVVQFPLMRLPSLDWNQP